MFLKNERESTTKMFDDAGWIWPLTETETLTADIPEG